MKELINEIENGIKEYDRRKNIPYKDKKYSDYSRGKGTKLYITKRIDLLREKLLEIKKVWIKGDNMNIFREIRFCYQRITRGYADRDLYNMDNWFINTISNMLKDFIKQHDEIFVSNEEMQQKIDRICYCLKESQEDTCSKVNEYEDEYTGLMFGDKKLSDIMVPCEDNNKLYRFEFGEVPDELRENYRNRTIQINKYRENMKNEALNLFKEIFYSLWW